MPCLAPLAVALIFSGCHWLASDWVPGQNSPTAGGVGEAVFDADETLAQLEQLLTVTVEPTRGAGGPQEVDGWYERPATPDQESPCRWRHTGLERWLGQPPRYRARLSDARRSKNSMVAAAATIGAARYEPDEHLEPLLRIISTATLSNRVRQAAIETFSQLDHPAVPRHLDELLDLYGQLTPQKRSGAYAPALHVELLRGLSRHVQPGDDERFLAALKSPDSAVRIASLDLLSAADTLPGEAVELIDDPHVSVRIAALRSVAATRHVDAVDAVRRAANDNDLAVRLAAIDALGRLGSPETREALQQIYAQGAERIREAAVGALAILGDTPSVLQAADDQSWRVRRAVAQALARRTSPPAIAVARRLLADPSVEVQTCTIQSVAQWPLAEAGPLLLKAAGSNNYRSRTTALARLAEQWPDAASIAPGDFERNRRAMLASLRQSWQESYGALGEPGDEATGDVRETIEISDQRVQEARRQLDRFETAANSAERQQARQALIQFDAELPAALWRLRSETGRPIPAAVYDQVLAEVSPPFAAIARLRSDDLPRRHRAAEELVKMAARRPLEPLAVARLSEVALDEDDPIVWWSLLEAIDGQSGQAANRLAYTALWNRSGEVRRRACGLLRANGGPQHVDALVGLMQDEVEVEVIKAAVRALGRCGPLKDPDPLMRLLAAGDKTLRVEAAEALAKLGYSDGSAALERATYDPDPIIRQHAARAMGELADPLFLSILIRLLDDRRDGVRRAALSALPRVASRDVVAQSDAPVGGSWQKAKLWKAWYETGGRPDTGGSTVPAGAF